METKENPTAVADDVVVSMEYTLTVDGQVVDSSEGEGPLEFIQGNGDIISGLEKALYGMTVNESKHVKVAAQEAYGENDPEAVMDVPRSEFPAEIPLKVGVQLQVRDSDGDVMDARIVSVDSKQVKLDFNHPLAGKDLEFDVKIVDLRAATEEELEHAHVHGMMDEDDEYYEELDLEEYDGEEDDEDFEDNGKKA